MPNPTPLTLAEQEDILQRYSTGWTTRRLGDRFGVSEAAIRRLLRRRGVQARPVGVHRPDVPDDQVTKLRDAGLSWSEVARETGLSMSGARYRYNAVKARQHTG